ncbi:carboxylesterase family protein [Nocardia camponoti]|uniref:carboxylesterase family protein n=1 Tax=Nocardia camponoti TaxID=1616106 RepID=UPI001667B61C|nr:carboxylesterase family protein [Nocardia camponoti]
MSDSAARPEIQLASGVVRGVRQRGIASFVGIPYAVAPRFGEPEGVLVVGGVGGVRGGSPGDRTAGDSGAGAGTIGPTTGLRGDSARGGGGERSGADRATEEVLTVDVFTPAGVDGLHARWPVLVWLLGDSAGAWPRSWFDGSSFARSGVVTVVVSSRGGFAGFGMIDGFPLNRGLLDQLAALRWVRDNIAAFGGDPDRVTVAGQGVGGGCVVALLATPAARGLFGAAIAQSAEISRMSVDQAAATTHALGAMLGVREPSGWLDVDDAAIAAHVPALTERALCSALPTSADALLDRVVDPFADLLGRPFAPVVDGTAFLSAEEGADTPLLIGCTANERVFERATDCAPESAMAALRAHGVGRTCITQFLGVGPVLGARRLTSQLHATAVFRRPAVQVVNARRAAGRGDATWMYDYRNRSPVDNAAAHGAEVPYVWNALSNVAARLGEHPPVELAARMHRDWVRFCTDFRCDWPTGTGAMIYNRTSTFDNTAYRLEWELAEFGATVRAAAARPKLAAKPREVRFGWAAVRAEREAAAGVLRQR